jgi:AP2-associated kinase
MKRCNIYLYNIGCVAYTLVYFKHPFVEASKLAITNASINFPRDVKVSEKL